MKPSASVLTLCLLLSLAACGSREGDSVAGNDPKLLATTVAVTGTATFTGNRSSYTIAKTATGYNVTDATNVVTAVGNVQYLQFADVKIDLSMGDRVATISAADLQSLQELYVAYFNRVPDADGLAYWIDQRKAGQTLDQIAASFYGVAISTPGLTGYSATMTDADFITIIYRNVLGRSTVDTAGMTYWTGQLAGGAPRSSLIQKILTAAHTFKGDAGYGWVATLLDNKIVAANYVAVQQGITYTTDGINKGISIAAAVTPTDVYPAIQLTNAVFGAGGPQVTNNSISDTAAVRLLLQSQFSASDAEIAAVRAMGPKVWLNAQMNAPMGQTGWNWLDTNGYNIASYATRYYDSETPADRMVWNQLMTSTDPVRKRAALALSEMMVVSTDGINYIWRGHAMANYWDTLAANAFGNFRTLLEGVTLNLATGSYLTSLGNLKEDSSGRQPDENYAREIMQLYTIGAYKLNLDGTEQLDVDGNKIETYTIADVSSLAHVFTGYQAPLDTGVPTTITQDNNRVVASTAVVKQMRQIATQHSTAAVSFIGINIPANTDGATQLRIALDGLFNHPNVGPFFAKQMIQRLVTSNPSPAYVARVASVFNNNGSGVRGDLKAVFAAILLDDEARSDAGVTTNGFGKVREPMLRLVQWARTFADDNARAGLKLGDYSDTVSKLGQSPLRAPTVFNFFRPGYVPPSTAMSAAGKVAPEFQIITESTVSAYVNMMQDVIRTGISTVNSDVSGNTLGSTVISAAYTKELALVNDPAALVARLNLLMCAGRMSTDNQTLIVNTLTSTPLTATATAAQKMDRVALAVLLTMASTDYLIQK